MTGKYKKLTSKQEEKRLAFVRDQLRKGRSIHQIKSMLQSKYGRSMHYDRVKKIRDELGIAAPPRVKPKPPKETEHGLVPARHVSPHLRDLLANVVACMEQDGVLQLDIKANGNVSVIYAPEEGSFEVNHG